MKDFLTPTMRNFVKWHVFYGYAMTEDEFIRFLIAQEIKVWEKVNHSQWAASVTRKEDLK